MKGLINPRTVKRTSDPSIGPHYVVAYGLRGGLFFDKSNTDREVWSKMKDPKVKSFIAYRITQNGGMDYDAHIYATEKSAIREVVKLKEHRLVVYKCKYTRKGICDWTESIWQNSKGFFTNGFTALYSDSEGHVTYLNNGKEKHHINKDGTIGRRLN